MDYLRTVQERTELESEQQVPEPVQQQITTEENTSEHKANIDKLPSNPHGGSAIAWGTVQLMIQNKALPLDDCHRLSCRLSGQNSDLEDLLDVCRVLKHSPAGADCASAEAAERGVCSLIRAAGTGYALGSGSCSSIAISEAQNMLLKARTDLISRLELPELVRQVQCGDAEEMGLRVEQTRVAICNIPYQIQQLLRHAGIVDPAQIQIPHPDLNVTGTRSYSSLMSGDAALCMQRVFAGAAPIMATFGGLFQSRHVLPLTFFVDATHMASGRKVEGVYMGLAQDPSCRVFLAALPSGVHCMQGGVQRTLLYQLAIAEIVRSLREAFIRGVLLHLGDTNINIHPYVLIAPLDWLASHELAAFSTGVLAQHNCMMCAVHRDDQSVGSRAARVSSIDHTRADTAYVKSLSMLQNLVSATGGSRHAMQAAIKAETDSVARDFGMSITPVTSFLALLPVSPACSGWSVCVTEPLHLLYQGLIKALLDAVGEKFCISNAKDRFDALFNLYPGLREHGRIERGGSWFATARRSGKLARRVLLHWPVVLADMSGFVHDDETAGALAAALEAACNLDKLLTQPTFTLDCRKRLPVVAADFVKAAEAVGCGVQRPKIHLLQHMGAWIELFGSPRHWDGAGFESLHVQFKKLAYGNSGCPLNRWAALEQLDLHRTMADLVASGRGVADIQAADASNSDNDFDDDTASMDGDEPLVNDSLSILSLGAEADAENRSESNGATITAEVSDGPLFASQHPAAEAEGSSAVVEDAAPLAPDEAELDRLAVLPASVHSVVEGVSVRATQPDIALAGAIRRIRGWTGPAYRVCRVNGVTFAHTVSYYGRPRADACRWQTDDGTHRMGFFVAWQGGLAVVQQLIEYASGGDTVRSLSNGSLILHKSWYGRNCATQVQLSGRWRQVHPSKLQPVSVVPLIAHSLLDQRGKYHVSRLVASSRWVHTRKATNSALLASLNVGKLSDGTPKRTWLWLRIADEGASSAISS